MRPPLRVLLVEDSPSDAKLVLHALQQTDREVEHERVQTAADMKAALARTSWDIVVSDWSMPAFSAPAALAVLKDAALDLPFIIVSGTIGEDHAVAAMRAGAHDYVLKSNLARLAPAVERETREYEARTAHRLVEAARLEAVLRFTRLSDAGIIGITICDMSGAITECNDTFLEMVGYTREDVSAGRLSWAAMTPIEWNVLVDDVRARVRTGGSARPFEKEYLRKDGSRVSVLVGIAKLDDHRTITVVTDLTERRLAEAALRASETRFSKLAECGIIGIALADTTGGLHEANDTYLRMLGYTRGELTKIPWQELTPPEWANADRIAVAQLRATGVATPWEKELFRKDGSRVPVLIGVAMLEDTHCIVFLADLTSQKLVEHANQRLEGQLRQSQKMEAVGRLAGGIAHDFNNILSVVLSYAEMAIADLGAGDPIRDDIEQIRRAGVRAANLTRQLLMFSRQQVIAPTVLDLNDLLAGLDKMLRRLVGEDVVLTSVAGSDLGHVRVDAGSIEQVLMNLAINARDAMPVGGKLTMETANVTLDDEYVKTHLQAAPGPHVMLAVSDTGTGMDKATIARIFEPFFTTKEVGKGTGLGLSTVFGIVQQSGGTIWVYSEVGIGTTFKVYLPRVDATTQLPKLERGPTTLRGSETILLVEDEDQVREVARGILRRHGYTVLVANSPGEALLLCEQHAGALDLLLTDVVMPNMSGPELAKRLAKVRPTMRVLCMSGYTDDAAVRHGVIDASFAYLQKPITVETLTRKVRAVLDAPRVGDMA